MAAFLHNSFRSEPEQPSVAAANLSMEKSEESFVSFKICDRELRVDDSKVGIPRIEFLSAVQGQEGQLQNVWAFFAGWPNRYRSVY